MDVEQFGQYRLEQLIGRGGMGEVFRAYDTVRKRVVALKRLPAHLAADETFQARFRKESALASRLSEPHIIPIHDFGEIDGRLYIDMRLVTGRDLGAVLAEHGPLTPERAAAIVAQVAGALDAAHADGLMHRDIKPSNVLLTGNPGREFVYLVDFGIARSVDEGNEAPLTTTGATVGTVDYMAPERFLGTGSDHRADIYSLTCLLFEALTGRKPFRGDGLPAMIHAHLNMDPPSPSRERPTVPPAFDGVVATGMSKDPADRYASAGALADAALAAVTGAAAADATTQTIDRPPVPQQPTARLPQQGVPLPPSRTVAALPTAGFTAPPPGDPPAPASRRLGLLAVVAALLVAVGVAVAVPLLSNGTLDPGASAASDETTETSTAETTTEEDTSDSGRPESLPDGDPDADQELWSHLVGDDSVSGGCWYAEPQLETIRSSLQCNALDPELDHGVRFDAHSSQEQARATVDDQASRLSGDPGPCDAGGTFTGEQSDRYMACGILPGDETTTSIYVISWTAPDHPIAVTIADDDASAAWQWFSIRNPF